MIAEIIFRENKKMEENHIGREIAKQRFSRSLSRDGLALHTGISAERLAALERGEALPDAAELSSLAEFFGVSADQLLGIAKNAPERSQSDSAKEIVLIRPHREARALRMSMIVLFGILVFLYRLPSVLYAAPVLVLFAPALLFAFAVLVLCQPVFFAAGKQYRDIPVLKFLHIFFVAVYFLALLVFAVMLFFPFTEGLLRAAAVFLIISAVAELACGLTAAFAFRKKEGALPSALLLFYLALRLFLVVQTVLAFCGVTSSALTVFAALSLILSWFLLWFFAEDRTETVTYKTTSLKREEAAPVYGRIGWAPSVRAKVFSALVWVLIGAIVASALATLFAYATPVFAAVSLSLMPAVFILLPAAPGAAALFLFLGKYYSKNKGAKICMFTSLALSFAAAVASSALGTGAAGFLLRAVSIAAEIAFLFSQPFAFAQDETKDDPAPWRRAYFIFAGLLALYDCFIVLFSISFTVLSLFLICSLAAGCLFCMRHIAADRLIPFFYLSPEAPSERAKKTECKPKGRGLLKKWNPFAILAAIYAAALLFAAMFANFYPNASDRIFGITLCALSLFAYVLFFAVRRSVCRAADLVFLFLRAAAAGMEIAIWFSLDSGAYPAGAPEWMFSVGLGLNTLSMAYIALFYKNVFEEKRPNTVAIVLFSILFFFRMYFSVFVFILAEYVLYTEIADLVLLFGLYFLKADRERFQEIESKKKAQKRKNKGRFSAR